MISGTLAIGDLPEGGIEMKLKPGAIFIRNKKACFNWRVTMLEGSIQRYESEFNHDGRRFTLSVLNNGYWEWSVRVDALLERGRRYFPCLSVSGRAPNRNKAIDNCKESASRLATVEAIFEL